MRFEILLGLPGNGPLPEYFSPTGHGRHREGFVVRFYPTSGGSWVGNFELGATVFSQVIEMSAGGPLTVVAGGQGYELDIDTRQCLRHFGGSIETVAAATELGAFIFSNGLWLEAVAATGVLWRTDRIAWDGIRHLNVHGLIVSGEAYDPMDDSWRPFNIDLRDGRTIQAARRGSS